jgi:2-iminobutanoate/2-iminopropanoate deaminase
MAGFEVFNPKTVHETIGYSHAVRMGDLLFVSGQIARRLDGSFVDPADLAGQVEQIFENLRLVLEAAGSGLGQVGKLTVLALSVDARPAIAEVRKRLWESFGYFPASTFTVVSALAMPEIAVEIEAIATVS